MTAAGPNPLSLVLIALMKGVTDREADPALWQALLGLQARVRDHVAILGLDLVLDPSSTVAAVGRLRNPHKTWV